MIKNKQRMTIKKIVVNLIRQILSLIFIAIFFIIDVEPSQDKLTFIGLITLAIIVIASLIFLIVNYLIYKNEYFYFTNDSICYEMKFIVKKQTILPYDKINIIEIKRSLLDRIFGISVLKLGSGNQPTFNKEEIKLSLDKEKAIEISQKIEEIIKKVKNNEDFDENSIEPVLIDEKSNLKIISSADFFKNAFFTEPLLISTFIVFLIMLITSIVTQKYLLICIFIPIYFLIGTANFISNLISYGNFSIIRETNKIKISYGLINLKSYSIPIEKTHGIVIGQTPLQKILGLGTLKMAVVGLSNTTNNNKNNNNIQTLSYALPIAKIDTIYETIDNLLGEYKEALTVDGKSPSSKSLKHYIIIPYLISLAILLPVVTLSIYFLKYFTLFIIPVYLLAITISYLKYKNSKIGIDNKYTFISNGAIFKNKIYCKTSSLLEVNKIAGFIRNKEDISTIKVNLRGYPGIITIRNIYGFDARNYK